ncbi:hypothetical protein ACFSRY_18675 [Pontibacter locisalis]|uniref:Uncharacterized protein n=1 Tax=Pontibacter locisalis TaxID=1719035 RepID=A0ABW5IRE0_9BACT
MNRMKACTTFQIGVAVALCLSLLAMSASAQDMERGKLLEQIEAMSDLAQSYSLYLPSSYTPSKQWPIIYVFDPAARGALAAAHFRYAAEKYGYIIAASNNSRNGDWSFVIDAMNAMTEDTQKRFALDEQRRYSSGFSGGARAAVYMALKTGEIAGVIGCGAGFPQTIGGPAYPNFDHVGIVGNQDANYYELNLVYEELSKMPHNELLITFNGGHVWPDSMLIEQGVAWLELQAMRRGLTPVDQELISAYKQSEMKRIEDAKNPAQQYFLVKQLYNSLNGLTYVSALQQEMLRLEKSEELALALKTREKIRTLEEQFWKQYGSALASISSTNTASGSVPVNSLYTSEKWWAKELKKVKEMALQLDEKEGSLLYDRIKSYIWITAVESFERAWQAEEFDQAANYLQVLSVVKPESPEPFFYLAKVNSKQRRYKLAMQNLEEAVQRGMSRYELVTEDALFEPLKKRKGFNELVVQMKEKREESN